MRPGKKKRPFQVQGFQHQNLPPAKYNKKGRNQYPQDCGQKERISDYFSNVKNQLKSILQEQPLIPWEALFQNEGVKKYFGSISPELSCQYMNTAKLSNTQGINSRLFTNEALSNFYTSLGKQTTYQNILNSSRQQNVQSTQNFYLNNTPKDFIQKISNLNVQKYDKQVNKNTEFFFSSYVTRNNQNSYNLQQKRDMNIYEANNFAL